VCNYQERNQRYFLKVRNKISRSKILHSNWVKTYNILEADSFVKSHREFRIELFFNVKKSIFIDVNFVSAVLSVLSLCLILST